MKRNKLNFIHFPLLNWITVLGNNIHTNERGQHGRYTTISRKVVGKSAQQSERYCGWFWVRCFSTKFERMARDAMDVCLRVLKESNKRSFDSYSVWNSVLIISHITFRDRRVHIFADNLSRNSCIPMSCSVLFKLRNRFKNMIETELLMCSRYSSQEINLTCLYVLLL